MGFLNPNPSKFSQAPAPAHPWNSPYDSRAGRKLLEAQLVAGQGKKDRFGPLGQALGDIANYYGQKRAYEEKDARDLAKIEKSQQAQAERQIAVEREKARLKHVDDLRGMTQREFTPDQEQEIAGLLSELDTIQMRREEMDPADYETMVRAIETELEQIQPAYMLKRKNRSIKDRLADGTMEPVEYIGPDGQKMITGYIVHEEGKDPKLLDLGIAKLLGVSGSGGKEKAEGPGAKYGVPDAMFPKLLEQAIAAALEVEGPDGQKLYPMAIDVPPEVVQENMRKLAAQLNPELAPAAAPAAAAQQDAPIAPLQPISFDISGKDDAAAVTIIDQTKMAVRQQLDSIRNHPQLKGRPVETWPQEAVFAAGPLAEPMVAAIAAAAKRRGGSLTPEEAAELDYLEGLLVRFQSLAGGQ